MKHELFEELDAFNPRWREHYPTIASAAAAASCTDLYRQWAATPEGASYRLRMSGVPDYQGAVKAAQEAADRLPHKIGD